MSLTSTLRCLLPKSFFGLAARRPHHQERAQPMLLELESRLTPNATSAGLGWLANLKQGAAADVGVYSQTSPGQTVVTKGAIDIATISPRIAVAAPTNLALSTGGSLTNNNKPTITGNALPDSTVKLYDTDGITLVGSGKASLTGSFSITLTTTLSDGSHSITATATVAGVTSAPSDPLTFTVDTIAPAAPTSLALSTGGKVSNTRHPTISGNAEPGSTVKLYDSALMGGTLIGIGYTKPDGTFKIHVHWPLGNGWHTVTATATDAAGNTSVASSPLRFDVEPTA